MEEQRAVVQDVLRELGLDATPQILVLNKADLCDAAELDGLVRRLNGVAVSALHTDTFAELMAAMESRLWGNFGFWDFRILD